MAGASTSPAMPRHLSDNATTLWIDAVTLKSEIENFQKVKSYTVHFHLDVDELFIYGHGLSGMT